MSTIKEKARTFDVVFDTLLRHPYIVIALLCALLLPFGFAQASQIAEGHIAFEELLWLFGMVALTLFGKPSKSFKINLYLLLSSAVMILLFSLMVSENPQHAQMMFIPVGVGIFQLGAVMYAEKSLKTDRLILLMMVLGVVVRYCYVLRYDHTQLQHDVGSFEGTHGHASYIMYWYENGLKLPDFDVSTRWQFYHPPLHHLLMALLIRIFTFFGMELGQAQQAIQILPMLYSSLCMVVCWRIFKLIHLDGAGLAVACAVVCFHPTFIIWSGAYNNDMLATLLMLLGVLWTLKWAKKPDLMHILPIAVCIGFGMMSKLSAWMVAPAVALVFLVVFIRNIKKPLPFIGQFAAFGVICVPAALWWQVRNLMQFGLPLTYVPDTNSAAMSVKDVPVMKRLFDFSMSQFSFPFEGFTMYGSPYNEYNPLIGLLKTSVFDEDRKAWFINELPSAIILAFGLLAIVGFVFLMIWLFKKNTATDFVTKAFFVIIFFTILISYYIFCFQFPYVCTENIRYCIPVIPILGIGLGYGVNCIGKTLRQHKAE